MLAQTNKGFDGSINALQRTRRERRGCNRCVPCAGSLAFGGRTRMTDYLQPVGRAWRIASIVGCTLTSIICVLLSLLLWTDMIRRHSLRYEGKPLWIGAAMVGFIGAAAAFIAWRLVRHHAASNGITVMPTWFIQLFGVLLLLGLCFVAYHRGNAVFVVEGLFICLAMIFVSRQIASRQKLRE